MAARLTDKNGEVRELTDADVKRMRPMSGVLPAGLQRTLTMDQVLKQYSWEHGQGQRSA